MTITSALDEFKVMDNCFRLVAETWLLDKVPNLCTFHVNTFNSIPFSSALVLNETQWSVYFTKLITKTIRHTSLFLLDLFTAYIRAKYTIIIKERKGINALTK